MKFLLGTKEEMTQIFDGTGASYPATVVMAGPCVVTQIKAKGKEGYDALQLGFGEKRKLLKPQAGHLKGLGNFRYLREVRVSDDEARGFKVGDRVDAALFAEGDHVRVSGISKGKGFQGVVKRHGFHGGPRSHG